MAVPYYKRSVSKKEYFYYYKKLRNEILSLLSRDFGILKTDDGTLVVPYWIIEDARKGILKFLSTISSCISRGTAFYPTTEDLKNSQLKFQIRAIQECYDLHDTIQFYSEVFPVKNKNVFTIIANHIQNEVLFLKYWKKFTKGIVISS